MEKKKGKQLLVIEINDWKRENPCKCLCQKYNEFIRHFVQFIPSRWKTHTNTQRDKYILLPEAEKKKQAKSVRLCVCDLQ